MNNPEIMRERELDCIVVCGERDTQFPGSRLLGDVAGLGTINALASTHNYRCLADLWGLISPRHFDDMPTTRPMDRFLFAEHTEAGHVFQGMISNATPSFGYG